MAFASELSDAEKVRIAADFLLQSPPGEFNEVFNDVRVLLNNDPLLEKGCRAAIAQYNKDQFVPVKVVHDEGGAAAGGNQENRGGEHHPQTARQQQFSLITPHNELPDGRFMDPKSGRVFKYDHLRKDASDVEPISGGGGGGHKHGDLVEEKLEPWRKALQTEADDYIHEHFFRRGVATVFTGKGNTVTLCIESHQFQPKNFWNGRWRSEWRLPAYVEGSKKESSGAHECTGTIRLQVHYYEDGNVQLISQKETKLEIKFTPSDIHASAKEAVRAICEHETKYQAALQESYAHMSENTFKALRRQLPVTRAKLDWLKLHSYRVAQDLKPQ